MIRDGILIACVLLALTSTSPAAARDTRGKVEEGGQVKVDEFLLPLPGSLDENLKLLEERVRRGGGSAEQALYGIQLLAGGNHALAKQHCREALDRGFLFEPVYCTALILFLEGKLAEAAERTAQAINLRPGSVAPYILLANIRRTEGDQEGMVKAVESGVAAVPERAEFWEWELAKLFEQTGDLDAALQCVGRLAKITPRDPRVFVQAGDWLRGVGREPEAVEMYQLALSKASWYEPAVLALLDTYKGLGRWLEIRTEAMEFLDNPQLSRVRDTVMAFKLEAERVLLEEEWAGIENRHQVSLTDLSTFEKIEPSEGTEILLKAADAAFRVGGYAQAVPLLLKARSLSPSDTRVAMMLGEGMLRSGQLELAALYVNDVLASAPSGAAHELAARVAQERGANRECVEHAKKALDYLPDSADLYLLLARCYRAMRESDEELSALEQAHKINPDNTAVLHELVAYFLHMRNGEEAAANYLEKLYSLVRYDFRLCIKLGDLRLGLGATEEAVSTWARCISSIPPDPPELREEVYGKLKEASKQVRSGDVIGAALRSACFAGLPNACSDLKLWMGGKKEKLKLKSTEYKAGGRRRKLVGELERIGSGGRDFLVLGLDSPGFEKLSRQEKIFLYFMNRAAIAGDDLLYMQNHRHALLIKQLMELLFMYRSYLPQATVGPIHDYLKLLWVNHGNYDHRSGVKFVPATLTPEMLLDAMLALSARGETFEFIPGLNVEEKLAFLKASIFDASHEPLLTVREGEKDLVLASAVNHYDPGITSAMIESLDPKLLSALNIRFSLRGGTVVPQYYRIGGLASSYIGNIVYFLERAREYAQSEAQAESIDALVEFYRTGEDEAFRRHSLAWLRSSGRTDYLNGFVEQLKDPRGTIGNYEGLAAFVVTDSAVEKLADEAGWFEERMPWPEQFKRKEVARPVTNVAVAVMGTGDMGPVPWAGYNLPNYDDIRSSVGSKNVIFINIMTARSQRDLEATLEEFYLPEYRALVRKYGDLVQHWMVYLHEIIGHGSGRASPDLPGDPRTLIGPSFSTIEEARADLVALYFIGDPKLEEIGAVPKGKSREVMACAYVSYFQGFLILYSRFKGGVIREPHWKARQMILQYLLNGGEDGKGDYGLSVVEDGGNMYVRVREPSLVREGVARLLERIQVVKSMGDRDSAERLVQELGTRYDETWASNIKQRFDRLGLPRQTAFVFPHLKPIVDRKGRVVDVSLHNDEDLTAQHLRFSRLQRNRDLE